MFDDTIKLQWQVAFVLVLDHRIQSHYKFAPHKYQYLLDYDHSNPHSNRKKNYNLILCDDKLEIINSFLLDILTNNPNIMHANNNAYNNAYLLV